MVAPAMLSPGRVVGPRLQWKLGGEQRNRALPLSVAAGVAEGDDRLRVDNALASGEHPCHDRVDGVGQPCPGVQLLQPSKGCYEKSSETGWVRVRTRAGNSASRSRWRAAPPASASGEAPQSGTPHSTADSSAMPTTTVGEPFSIRATRAGVSPGYAIPTDMPKS